MRGLLLRFPKLNILEIVNKFIALSIGLSILLVILLMATGLFYQQLRINRLENKVTALLDNQSKLANRQTHQDIILTGHTALLNDWHQLRKYRKAGWNGSAIGYAMKALELEQLGMEEE